MDPIDSESAVKVVTAVRPLIANESGCKDIISVLPPGSVSGPMSTYCPPACYRNTGTMTSSS